MPAPVGVQELVSRFQRNLDGYKHDDYKETRVRVEFVDPLFEALGWDVRNVQGYAEQYKDVIHEDAIKVSGATRAPDYCFRVGGTRKFFLEVKKPSVSISADVGPAYQLRRYAWSARLALGVVTDFEEFAVYDCRARPRPNDKSSVGRVIYLTYDEYIDRWDEIHSIFAKESVLQGSFDGYVQETKKKRGTSEVDAEFLREIEGWRDTLARNIALRNPVLTVYELNYSVQRTIDRIVFLRMCEDRGIEVYGRLLALVNGADIYLRLGDLYRQADEKYNAGLFDFRADTLSTSLTIDDKVLKPILNSLYYPQCPYEFSVLPADVLGQVYEQFLGKVIRLTPKHRAVVEEKPEVKKAGGVYYTPTYIVDYIVKQTVGRLVDGKSPSQISDLRILDPACGSGSFLLGAYQYLLDHHLRWYEENDPEKHSSKRKPPVRQRRKGGGWRLTTAEKKRILLSNIYGVDIDRQAVEVTKLSLLLKVLEGESEETLGRQMSLWREPALPDLVNNIKCGNSLIGPDYFNAQLLPDEEEMRRVNPFDWAAEFPKVFADGGFDAVIGNPPYLKEYTYRQPFRDLRGTKLEQYYQGKMDIWYIFGCQAIDLLKRDGLHSFIATNNWITNAGASILRQKITSETQFFEFVDFGSFHIFHTASIQTMIYTLQKTGKPHRGEVHYRRIAKPKTTQMEVQDFLFQGKCDGFAASFDAMLGSIEQGEPFTFTNKEDSKVLECIATAGIYRLKPNDVAQGIVAPQDFVISKHLLSLRDKTIKAGDGVFVLTEKEKLDLELSPEELSIMKPFYTTHELGRYYGSPRNHLWIVYTASDIKSRIHNYPRIKNHLDRLAPIITSAFGPYGLHRARDERFFEGEKIISVRKTVRPQFTFTDFPCYVSQTFYILKPKDINLKYLLGLLNSQLAHFWLDRKGKKQGNHLQVDKQPLLRIPIYMIDFAQTADVARHDKMVVLVERMLDLHKKLAAASIPADKTLYQRQIDATDVQIDALVYQLYDLTKEEIAIVEER